MNFLKTWSIFIITSILLIAATTNAHAKTQSFQIDIYSGEISDGVISGIINVTGTLNDNGSFTAFSGNGQYGGLYFDLDTKNGFTNIFTSSYSKTINTSLEFLKKIPDTYGEHLTFFNLAGDENHFILGEYYYQVHYYNASRVSATISAVPEPKNYILLIFGFIFIGLLMRKRY